MYNFHHVNKYVANSCIFFVLYTSVEQEYLKWSVVCFFVCFVLGWVFVCLFVLFCLFVCFYLFLLPFPPPPCHPVLIAGSTETETHLYAPELCKTTLEARTSVSLITIQSSGSSKSHTGREAKSLQKQKSN